MRLSRFVYQRCLNSLSQYDSGANCGMLNPFIHRAAAQRYAHARPYHHPVVIERILDYLRLERPMRRALDVACGTGLSCHALTEMVGGVVGIDSSSAMLSEAAAGGTIRYVASTAEDLPFQDGSFDIITVSSAFHWLDRGQFLLEANRLLPRRHWLIVYTNHFNARMKGNPAFEEWMHGTYYANFPSPPRNWSPLTEAEAGQHGFCFARNESYSNDVDFGAENLGRYLTTQSNIIAAVERGKTSLEEVCQWLNASLEPFFLDGPQTFEFGGTIWYLQKQA